jgi:hypothetical protein
MVWKSFIVGFNTEEEKNLILYVIYKNIKLHSQANTLEDINNLLLQENYPPSIQEYFEKEGIGEEIIDNLRECKVIKKDQNILPYDNVILLGCQAGGPHMITWLSRTILKYNINFPIKKNFYGYSDIRDLLDKVENYKIISFTDIINMFEK